MPVCIPCLGIGVRHIQYLTYAIVFSIGFCIQEITLNTLKRSNEKGEGVETYDGYWDMSSTEEGNIRQALFLSFAIGRISSAVVCLKVNNKYLLIGFALFENTLTLMTFWVIADRNILLVGMCFSIVAFTRAFHWTLVMNMLAKWVPPNEYTTANAIIVVIREMFSFMMRIFMASTKTLDDSKKILIVFTCLSLLWAFSYLVVGAEGPDTSFLLSKSEHAHLAKCIGPRKKTRCSSKAPWKSMLFGTLLLYGWLIADFGRECSVTIIADGFQLGLDKFTDVSVTGVYVGLCFAYVGILGISVLSDKLIIKEVLTPGQVRKIYSSVGCCGASISMILAAYSERNSPTFAFIIVGQLFSAVMAIGQPVALFDISPNYAAVIFAIFSFLRTVLFAVKVVIDVRLHIYPLTEINFDVLFYRYGFLVFFTNLIFLLCGDIERKPFDTYDTQDWTKESIISYP